MGYLDTYATRSKRFQEGGMMTEEAPAGPEAGAPAGPEAGPEQDAQGEQLLALAEAAVGGDQQAAAELGMALAPMILEQVQAETGGGAPEGGGGEPMPEGGEPTFSAGGTFIDKR